MFFLEQQIEKKFREFVFQTISSQRRLDLVIRTCDE